MLLEMCISNEKNEKGVMAVELENSKKDGKDANMARKEFTDSEDWTRRQHF